MSLCLVLGVLPPLSEGQREQVASGVDAREHNQPALYALLANVMEWEPGATRGGAYAGGLVPGATVPDFAAVAADPGSYRGDLFMVMGKFAGRQRRMPLSRPGPWGEELTEWGVVAADGTVAMIYFVDPGGTLEPPSEGTQVRLVGRFFKMWNDVDAEGNAAAYPVFVARAAERVNGEAIGSGGSGSGSWVSGGVIAGVVVMVGVLFYVRRLGRGAGGERERVLARMREEARRYEEGGEVQGEEDDENVLPEDAAAALGVLDERGE